MHLYINKYGAYLHIKDGMFQIKYYEDGKEIKKRVPPQKVQSIMLDKGTALSYEVVKTALEHNIDIVFNENDGTPIGRIWHSRLGSTTKIRKRQLEVSNNEEGVKWMKDWICQKLERQTDVLKELKKHRKAHADLIDTNTQKMKLLQDKIRQLSAEHTDGIADTLRGIEGSSGRYYFSTLSALMNENFRFKGRSSRPAKDPFNAFLNYGYGILYSRVEKNLIIAGLDPYVGFLHRDDYNQKSFVFDFIEPYRPYVDIIIYRLFSGKKVNKDHYRAIANGIGLTKEGKKLIVQSFVEKFDGEKHRYKGRNMSRMLSMKLDAHQFSNNLINAVEADNTDVDLTELDILQ